MLTDFSFLIEVQQLFFCLTVNLSYSDLTSNFNVITSGWLSFQAFIANNSYILNKFACGLILSSTNNKGLWVGIDDSVSGKIALYKYDGTTKTVLSTETGTSFGISIYSIDMQIDSYTSNSTINLYLANIQHRHNVQTQ